MSGLRVLLFSGHELILVISSNTSSVCPSQEGAKRTWRCSACSPQDSPSFRLWPTVLTTLSQYLSLHTVTRRKILFVGLFVSKTHVVSITDRGCAVRSETINSRLGRRLVAFALFCVFALFVQFLTRGWFSSIHPQQPTRAHQDESAARAAPQDRTDPSRIRL
jgi:hypothetical protein